MRPSVGPGIGARATAIPVAVPAVDPEKCAGCGECAKACPFGAIEVKGGVAVVNAALCQGCRACASVCPTGAIA